MKLNELYIRPIKEVIDEMKMVDMKVHSDNEGNVRGIEVKFADKEEKAAEKNKLDRELHF